MKWTDNTTIPASEKQLPKTAMVELPRSVLLARIQRRLDEYWEHSRA